MRRAERAALTRALRCTDGLGLSGWRSGEHPPLPAWMVWKQEEFYQVLLVRHSVVQHPKQRCDVVLLDTLTLSPERHVTVQWLYGWWPIHHETGYEERIELFGRKRMVLAPLSATWTGELPS